MSRRARRLTRGVGLAAAAALLPGVVAVPAAAGPLRTQRMSSGTVTSVTAPVPADASAVVASVTTVDGTSSGYVSGDRCSSTAPGPQATALGNHGVSAAASNLALVRTDPGGVFCLVNQSPVNLIADVQGYFGPAAGGATFEPTPPRRVLDTRNVAAERPGTLWITPVATGAPAGTVAVVVNIAVADAARAGYVTADRCSRLTPEPQARATAVHPATAAVSNLAIVPVDADGRLCIFTLVPAHLVVDVHGWFGTSGGLRFAPAQPTRLLDSRSASAVPVAGGSITRVTTGLVPGTRAALVALTMVDGGAAGYVTADRCSALAPGPQPFASGNHPRGGVVSNLALVRLDDDASFCIANAAPVHLVADVVGSFDLSAPDAYVPVDAVRVLDTRPPGGEPPVPAPTVPTSPTPLPAPAPAPGGLRTSCRAVVHIGDSTSVGMVSPAILPDAADRLPAQYQRVGVAAPRMEISGARSILETLPGQTNARDVARAIKAAGYEGCWVFALGTTDTANLAKEPRGVSRRDRIDLMMAIAGDDPVLWVNTKTIVSTGFWSDPWMQVWNAELRAAAGRYPNLEIYDWAAVVQRGWFSGDGIHYTPAGYGTRAHLIADALAVSFPG